MSNRPEFDKRNMEPHTKATYKISSCCDLLLLRKVLRKSGTDNNDNGNANNDDTRRLK